MGFQPFFGQLAQVATTGEAGFALQNGTPVITSWTAPNDGQPHIVMAIVSNQIGGVAEVGGAVGWTSTNPGGGTTAGVQLLAGGSAANSNHHGFDAAVVGPGTTVSIVQNSALTGGGPVTVWAELWGA